MKIDQQTPRLHILFGLPRLLVESSLAHMMMHAWRHLNGYPNLSPEVKEGICQVLAHMWLDSELIAGSGSSCVTSLPSSSSTLLPSSSLGSLTDGSTAYGDGFRQGTDVARQEIVFATAIKSLMVIGPHAHVTETMISNYEVTPCKQTTPLQGISAWTSTNYQRDCINVACITAQIMIRAGVSVAYILGIVLTWRTLALTGLVPCALLLLGLFFIPESPRWLAKKGVQKKFEAALQKLCRKDADITFEAVEIENSIEELQLLPKTGMLDLFQKDTGAQSLKELD
ncbi:hypothetical protein Nepgr_005804 [Nepenthes gracilis]|uniref:Protein DA1-like domain-containing protein n=1 Tax=Nepenthes gracilis TaxID=150966 RepID=A0AAD3S468_NEPGR|nr:hypothetical protein Nepgr_005804 [Nepenthes gracilis]